MSTRKIAKPLDGAGAGVTAHHSPTIGMLMSQSSKPYFLHVMVVGGKGPKGAERFLTVAKKIVEKG